MLCLNCGSEMMEDDVLTKHGEIQYDTCEKCGSLWLDAGELDKMAFQVEGSIESSSEEKDDKPDPRPLKCPRCDNSVLDRVRFLGYPDIILHRCANCGGFWLDGGELNIIDAKLRKIMPTTGNGFSDFVNNVHVPYWYKRIQRKSDEVDFHWEVMPIKGAQKEGDSSDSCPNCGQTLSLYKVFGMPFEGCSHCKGVWLVSDELRKLKNKVHHGSLRWMDDEIEEIGKASARRTDRSCVQCKTVKMVAVVFGKSSIIIDWCPQCHGVWLDCGEFEGIIDYLNTERAGMKPQEVKQEAIEEVKRLWTGGPENRLEDARDAVSALSAILSAAICEHPKLFDFLQSFRSMPMP